MELIGTRWVCPCAPHEDVWRSRASLPLILILHAWWRWAASYTPQPLYHRVIRPQYILNKRLRRAWSLSERFVGKKNLISIPGICCLPLLRTGNIGCFFSCLTYKRLPNAPLAALTALVHTPRVGVCNSGWPELDKVIDQLNASILVL